MKPKMMLAFIAGVAATVGLLAALTLSANLQVTEAQVKPDEMAAERHEARSTHPLEFSVYKKKDRTSMIFRPQRSAKADEPRDKANT